MRHEIKLIVKQILFTKLVKYWNKYTKMHGQQNVRTANSCVQWKQKSSCFSLLVPSKYFFRTSFYLEIFFVTSSRLGIFFPRPFSYLNCFIASFLSRLIFLVPSSSLNIIFPHLFLPRNIYRSPLSSLNNTFSPSLFYLEIFFSSFFHH